MASRVALPESKLKRRRRIRRTRLSIAFGVLLLILAATVVGASWIPQLRIKHVSVRGLETLASSTVAEFATKKIDGRMLLVFPKDNILLYPKKEVERGLLKEFPALKDAVIHADNFEAITINAAERHPKALWCGESPVLSQNCRLMDEGGFVYSPGLENALSGLIRYTGAATTTRLYTAQTEPLQYLTAREFAALEALVDALGQNQKQTAIAMVDVDAHSDVRVIFENNFMLLFALKDAGSDVYERFTLALASGPFLNKTINDFDYLDLRFGDKLYYRLKTQ